MSAPDLGDDERALQRSFERSQAAEAACNDMTLLAMRGAPLPREECERRTREYEVAHAEWLEAWQPFMQGIWVTRSGT